MKKLILLVIIFIWQVSYSQWEPTAWENEALISLHCVKGDTIIIRGTNYLSNDDGYIISTNKGNTWQNCDNGIPYGSGANTIAIIDSNIFFGGFGFLYISSDLGKSWQKSSIGLPDFPIVDSFVIIGKKIYAALDGGVFLSTDMGKTWAAKNNGIAIGKGHGRVIVIMLAKIGENIFVSAATGIYLSTDMGETWISKNNGLGPEAYKRQLVVTGENIFIGTNEDTFNGSINDLYLSTDMGENWVKKNNSVIAKVYAYKLAAIGNNLFVSDKDSLFLSPDSGGTWRNVTKDIPYQLQQGIITFGTGGSDFYAASYSELYVSKDSGMTWSPIRTANNYGTVETMYLHGDDIYVGTTPLKGMTTSRAGLFLSNDMGVTWQPIGLEGFYVRSICVVGNNIIAGTGAGVYLSTDSGLTWQQPDGLHEYLNVSLFTDEEDNVFATSGFGIYHSSDCGFNWELRNNGLPNSPWANYIAFSGNYIIAGLDSGVYISSDLGLNWYEKNNGLPPEDREVWTVAASGNMLFMGTRNNLYRSTDLGESWELKKDGLPNKDVFVNDMEFLGNNIFLASGRGIFLSNNNGESWVPKNNGFADTNAFFTSIVVSGEYILTGTNSEGFGSKGDKIYRAKISNLIVNSVDDNCLISNLTIIPNPFSQKTKIFFNLDIPAQTKLTIYNSLGYQVAVLISEYLPEGKHEAIFDGANLASGTYYIVLQSGSRLEMGKLILINN